MTAPMEQVLGTVELLDLVLCHLSMRDLLACQRVSFLWSEVISKSRTMQVTKYLLPDTHTSLSEEGSAQTNPLYLQRFVQQACFYTLRQIKPTVHFLGMDRFVLRTVKSFEEPDASWHKMLLFQPPVSHALLRPMSAHFEDEFYFIRNKSGLTMGDVVELIKERANSGLSGIELLSSTVIRKVVWSVMPVA